MANNSVLMVRFWRKRRVVLRGWPAWIAIVLIWAALISAVLIPIITGALVHQR